MMRSDRPCSFRLLLAAATMLVVTTFVQADAPKAEAELFSSVAAIAPDQPFELAVRFKLEEGWHIYWQNSGDSGMPPQFQWHLPAGFTISRPLFPPPKKEIAGGGIIVTNILEDEATLLFQVTPPPTLASGTVEIKADAAYLVCKQQCVRETSTLSLKLPVVAEPAEVKPANEEVFSTARRRLPREKGKYVELAPRVEGTSFATGETVTLHLDVHIKNGLHIQSDQPLNPAFLATELYVEQVDGIIFESPQFPKPDSRTLPGLGRITEFHGKITIDVEGTVEEAVDTPFTLGGVFKYQACNEKGMCFPPEYVAFAVRSDGSAADPLAYRPADPSSVTYAEGTATPDNELQPTVAAASGDSEGAGDDPGAPTQAGGQSATSATTGDETGTAAPKSFIGWMAFAFVGGLILNIMPCVLPVISIKILSFVQQASDEPGRVFRLGLTFFAGIVTSFVALALVVIAIKSTGESLGWGFQFQSPAFVIAMIAIIFVFSLSLFGVFIITLPGGAVTTLAAAEEREGYLGAFLKGTLATVLATPCSAPFLGPALTFAFAATTGQLLLLFTTVGVGMGFPYVLLTANPRWLKFLPRPGAWMETFKQFMGFVLMGTVVWLLFTVGALLGADGVIWTIAFLGFLAMAAWLLGHQTPSSSGPRRVAYWGSAVAVALVGTWFCYSFMFSIDRGLRVAREARKAYTSRPIQLSGLSYDPQLEWQPWTKGRPRELAAQGYTVFVDYTATWCPNCIANKITTIESEAVRKTMSDLCAIPVKADFTDEDPEILADIESFGRSAIPLNVVYPAGRPDNPIVLPENLIGRQSLVLDTLREAGPSANCKVASSAP